MFRAISSGLAIIATVLLLSTQLGAAAPAGKAVTTKVTIVIPPNPYSSYGELQFTFRAVPAGDGIWAVEVFVKPHQLVYSNGWGWHAPVRGTGTAEFTAVVGEEVSFYAWGMWYSDPYGRQDYPVFGTVSVDANGVVAW